MREISMSIMVHDIFYDKFRQKNFVLSAGISPIKTATNERKYLDYNNFHGNAL